MKLKNLKNLMSLGLLVGTLCYVSVGCKSKVSDADLKAKVENVVSASSGIMVDVKDGVVTLSGTVNSEEERMRAEEAAKGADKSIKTVVNSLSVESSMIDINTDDSDLAAKVVDATKDFPDVVVAVKDGIITVSGSVEQSRVQILKQSLDALSPKRVDMSALNIK